MSSQYNATTGSGPKSTIKNATGTVAENGTIYIAQGTYYESGINIDKSMNIIGENHENTIINGQQTGNGIFTINTGITVNIINLTLTNATTIDYSNGGAIYNYGGTLTVKNSTFTNNTAYEGGAIINYNCGTLTVENCTFTGNTATYGGAIYNDGTLTINSSTFTSNTATYGEAISNYYSTNVSFCRIIKMVQTRSITTGEV